MRELIAEMDGFTVTELAEICAAASQAIGRKMAHMSGLMHPPITSSLVLDREAFVNEPLWKQMTSGDSDDSRATAALTR